MLHWKEFVHMQDSKILKTIESFGFNTHFDHIGVKARSKSVKIILKKIRKINKEKYQFYSQEILI